MSDKQKNVFGRDIANCSRDPLTGWMRDGCCNTDERDRGVHTVCTRVTQEFLEFSKSKGNDLSTPRPEYSFVGLKAGDQWCLCAARWKEAFDAGCAPHVVLEATHEKTLEICSIEELMRFALDVN